MNEPITIVQGKDKNGYYYNDKLILCSDNALSPITELLQGLGLSYTYLEMYDLEEFPETLSRLVKNT